MPYYGEEGVEIFVDTDYVLTGATLTVLRVKKPETKTVVSWIATIVNTDTLYYVTTTDDLDEVGVYEIQPKVEIGTKKLRGDPFTMKVGAVID